MSMKEPMHPGKVLKEILHDIIYPASIAMGISPLQSMHDMTSIDKHDLEKFLNGEIGVDYVIAFKLGKSLHCTDMAFWLKLQKDYDGYKENEAEDRYDVVTDLIQLREGELYLMKLNKDMEEYRASCIKESIDNDMSESIRSLDEDIDSEEKLSKVIDIINKMFNFNCEHKSQGRGSCIEENAALYGAKEIIKLFEPDASNKKESIKAAIFSAKSFLDNALTELEGNDIPESISQLNEAKEKNFTMTSSGLKEIDDNQYFAMLRDLQSGHDGAACHD